jgi:hypothetical protein
VIGRGNLSDVTFTAFDRFRKTLTLSREKSSGGASEASPVIVPSHATVVTDDDWSEHIDAIWDIAHRDHAEFLRHEAKSQPMQHSRIERFFITPFTWAARAFAGTTMITIWFCIIGPIWFAILLRTIAAFSIATVVALFTHATPPDVKRLDAVAELWVVGFRKIIASTFQNEPGPANRVPIEPLEAAREVALAILLYGGMYTTFLTMGTIHKYIFG